ncbi:MAG TPA: FkbM family methyltransferase [Rhizobiaceae bacterium]|nr:FkbM family methyltransferase [Rhizobiaceae bacterium]
MVRPTKVNALRRLCDAGMKFSAIADVGVMEQTRELREVFPDLKHFLFEPVVEFHSAIRSNYDGVSHELVPVAVSDADGTANLVTRALNGGKITHSGFAPVDLVQTKDTREIRTLKLDTFFAERPELDNLLLKIDVDGAELRVLAGARETLARVNCVVLEASRTTYFDRYKFLHENGFMLFDMVDFCYYGGAFHQCDLVFIKSEFYNSPQFNLWLKPPFDPKQWVSIDESIFTVQNTAATVSTKAEPRKSLLGAVVIPSNSSEVPQILANFALWATPGFAPCIVEPQSKARLIISFNNDTAQAAELQLQAAFEKAGLERYFSSLSFVYCDLYGDKDRYERDYSKAVGQDGFKAGPNNQFFETLRLARGMGPYIFLMEADCVPIRPDWLSRLGHIVSEGDSFWIMGSAYRGAGTLDDQFRRHINGNAIYNVEDPEFIAFIQDWWRPKLASIIAEADKRIAYDCALELAFAKPWREDRDGWEKWKQVAHEFRFTTYIQNISGNVDINQPRADLVSSLLKDPETYVVHNRKVAEAAAAKLKAGEKFNPSALTLA